MAGHIYDKKFYENQCEDSLKSASKVVPLIEKLFQPKSVADVGCGIGTWLSAFNKKTVSIFGFDGDYVNRDMLLIDADNFQAADLSKPLITSQKFDLVMSLEVAEHIAETSADTFVENITSLSDLIVFGAAIPQQGGENHVNEQWQDYWVEKFKKRGYYAFDCIRPNIWNDIDVAYTYRTNTLVYTNNLSKYDFLQKYQNNLENDFSFNLVHPEFFTKRQYELLKYKQRLKESYFWALGLLIIVSLLIFTLK